MLCSMPFGTSMILAVQRGIYKPAVQYSIHTVHYTMSRQRGHINYHAGIQTYVSKQCQDSLTPSMLPDHVYFVLHAPLEHL